MARRYASIWNQLKKEKKCTITCKPAKMDTIVRCVRKEKSRENAPRHSLEIPSFGRLRVKREISNGVGIIYFRLVHSFKSYEL